MTMSRLLRAATAATSLLICACGSSASQNACKSPPTAVSGPAQSIGQRQTVQLVGSAADTHGSVQYDWRFEAVPPGSAAVLSSGTSASPSFTADVAGVYVAALIVHDSCGASAPVATVITAVNHVPLASAGLDQHVAPGDAVALDGRGSSDADLDPLTYRWSLILRPAGSTAALDSATSATPKFLADLPGSYVATLAVSDGASTSAPAEVVVQANRPGTCNGGPTALPGPAQTVNKRASVQLSGSAVGTNGTVAYAWAFVAVPPGSTAVLSSPTAANASFTPDVSGVYVASLSVRDACASSAPATAVITVANRAPVASAGPDRVVLAPGTVITLDGTASSDADQDPITYQWTFFSRPPNSTASLSSANVASPHFVPDLFGTYILALVVSDGAAVSLPSEVQVLVGVVGPNGTCTPAAAPVASAGPDQSVSAFSFVQLDGTGSTTGRGVPLVYRWSLVASPVGSVPSLSSPQVVRPSLSTDRPGDYTASLVVNDGCVDSAPSTVKVTRANFVPSVFVFQVFQPAWVLLPFTLSASVFDPDNQPLTYLWQLTSAPTGSKATLSSATAVQPTFTPDLGGAYGFSLVVSDGVSSSTPAVTTVAVTNSPPSASGGPGQSVGVGTVVTLNGFGNDPSHRPLTFAWSLQKPATSAAVLSSATASQPTFVADLKGVYKAQLTVTAGGLTSLPATTTISAVPPVARLAHRVLDAAYSTALDTLVVIAADPSALYLYDARNPGGEVKIPLSLVPSSVSLSPDGKFAAVGHTSAISYVDLALATVKVIPVPIDVARVTLGDNLFVYAFPRVASSDHVRMLAVPVAGGSQQSVTSSLFGAASGKVRPGAGTLYLTNNVNFFSSGLEEYTLSGGTPLLAVPSAPFTNSTCGDLWFSQAASRLFTRCGDVLHASSAAIDDLTPAGKLEHSPNLNLALRHLDDSTAASEISAVASEDGNFFFSAPDDRTLRSWNATGLTAKEVLPLPKELANGATFQWSGRFVFYRSDGTERYVVLQLDPLAGATQDFGVAVY